jgi:hypothetical protein
MAGTSALSAIEKPRWVLLVAVAALATGGGCFEGTRQSHHHTGDGTAGVYGGQGGNPAGGGQGGQRTGAVSRCDPGASPSFAVQWSLEDRARQPTTCAAVGGATMDLDVLEVASSQASHDTFPCDALAGTGAALAPGDYAVALRLRNSAGDVLSEAIAPTTYPVTAGCVTNLGLVPFEAVVTAADPYITLSWNIDRVLTGATLSCADAHASKVVLTAGTTPYEWPCGAGKGATPPLAPGSYDVNVKLLDATGTALSLTPTMPVTLSAGQLKALGTVIFDVN